MVWYRPGTSADQTRRDLAFCQNEALLNQRSTIIQGNTLGQAIVLGALASSSENSRENQIVQNCMIERGYTLLNLGLLEEIKAKAERGDAESECVVGQCYYQGKGVEKDAVEAVRWLRMAADQNYATAQFNLGVCYEYGTGVEKDDAEASKLYSLAAAQGDQSAKAKLIHLKNFDAPTQPQPVADIHAQMLGHWTLIPFPGIKARAFDVYFLTTNRYKMSLIKANGDSVLEVGRYYFTGNTLVTWGDEDEKPTNYEDFSVTETKLQFRTKQSQLVFQKQTNENDTK